MGLLGWGANRLCQKQFVCFLCPLLNMNCCVWSFHGACFPTFYSILRPIPTKRPSVVLLGSPLFCRHVGCSWVWEPKFTIVLFDRQNGPIYVPKSLRFQGKCSIWGEKHYKTRERAPKRTSGGVWSTSGSGWGDVCSSRGSREGGDTGLHMSLTFQRRQRPDFWVRVIDAYRGAHY